MAYIFTAITGGQNVGEAFTRVNQNLAAIEDNITTGGTVSGNFLPLSGGTLDENASIKLPNASSFNTLSLSANSINFYDDFYSTNINIKPNWIAGSEAAINIIDTLPDGYMVIVPTPSGEGGKDIRVNAGGDGWEYYDSSAVFLALTGGTVTGDVVISANLSANTLNIQDQNDGGYNFKIDAFDTSMRFFGTDGIEFFNIDSGNINLGTTNKGGINVNSLTAIRTFNLPDKDGTFALLSDLTGATVTGYVRNTGDTITGTYTINDGPVDGARIDMYGISPIIYMEGDGSVVRLKGTDIIGKSNLYSTSLVFDNDDIGSNASSLQIRPLLSTTTGSSTLDIIKPTGNTNGYFVTVGNIATKSNEVIKINNAGTGFDTIAFSGSGSVGVTYSPTSITIIGSGATRVTSAGTGTINILSSITNNNLVQKSIAQGSQMLITDNGSGTITFAANPSEGCLFNSLGNTFANTTTAETSVIFSSLRGSATLSASTATTLPQQTAGRRYRFTANGTIQSAAAAGNLTARMKLGSVLIASSATFTVHNSIPANTTFYIEASFTVRTAGAAGTIQSRGIMHITHTNFVGSGSNSAGIGPATTSNFNTQTDKVFDFTLQWGTSNASNAWVINEASLEYMDI